MISIGQLDRRIVIQTPRRAEDTFGQEKDTWIAFKTVWAKVTTMKAHERFVSDTTKAIRVSTFTIRYIAGIDPKMRILHDSQYYSVTGIAEIGRREWLELTAEFMEKHGEGNA